MVFGLGGICRIKENPHPSSVYVCIFCVVLSLFLFSAIISKLSFKFAMARMLFFATASMASLLPQNLLVKTFSAAWINPSSSTRFSFLPCIISSPLRREWREFSTPLFTDFASDGATTVPHCEEASCVDEKDMVSSEKVRVFRKIRPFG